MVGILFLLLVFRIPYFLMDIPLTQPELLWQMIGERAASGNLPYVDTIDGTGPFSVSVYWLNHLLAANSLVSFRVISFLIILFQIYYTNELLIKINAYEESNFIPAFVMTILFQLSFDFMTLSPALMGSTFVLLALGHLLQQTTINANTVPAILLMGFCAGVAFCFHFAYLVFLPFLILAAVLIIGFSIQQLCLLLTAYLLPLSFCAVFFFMQEGLSEFITLYLFLSFQAVPVQHVSLSDLLFIFSFPVLLAIFGYFKNNLLRRMNVTQQKQNQLLLVFLLVNLASFFLVDRVSPYQFLAMLPALAYFTTHLFNLSNKRMLQQTLIYGYLILLPLIGYSWVFYQIESPSFDTYVVRQEVLSGIPASEKIMVLGENLEKYTRTGTANPYLNFRLTRVYFEQMNAMERKMKFLSDLQKESPDVIIDEEGLYLEWSRNIPSLETLYRPEKDGVIRKISN
ncbi:hypothetical protein [Cyclobacterium roseum]|uniref:hypothetical protein n=1 Tax=Cyclobacterium roseum TaxID=2666137 RepID=UPI001391CE62|nr:hypothetical protein [Cyclobacterium roseum]